MRVWGCEKTCVLCGQREETRDYFNFACPYTYTIWSVICGGLLDPFATPDW